MNNIHLLDSNQKIKKYDNVQDIMQSSLLFVCKSTKNERPMLKDMARSLDELTNKIRFINHVVDGSIPIRKVKQT